MALMIVYLINQDGILLSAVLGIVNSDTLGSDDSISLEPSQGLLLGP